jgi:hypothetical protein
MFTSTNLGANLSKQHNLTVLFFYMVSLVDLDMDLDYTFLIQVRVREAHICRFYRVYEPPHTLQI